MSDKTTTNPKIQLILANLEKLQPYVHQATQIAQHVHVLASPFYGELLLLLNIILLFFGGNFVLLFTTFAAVKTFGVSKILESFGYIYEFYKIVIREAQNESGENPYGVPKNAFKYISSFLIHLNQEQMSSTFAVIIAAFLTIVASVQSSVAQSVSMGMTFGNTVATQALTIVEPRVKKYIPEQYHEKISPLFTFVVKGLTVLLSFLFVRWMTLVSVCTVAAEFIVNYVESKGLFDVTPFKSTLITGLTFVGVLKQFALGFEVSGIFGLLFAPVLLAEYLLGLLMLAGAKN